MKTVFGNISDKNPFVIAEPLAFKPGTTWNYINEGVQLLPPILDQAAGEPIQEYARKRLFEPLGMRNTKLHLDSAGHAWTYADMETSARDFARIGMLMTNGGKWQDKRFVSQKWIDESVHPSQTFNSNYGLLWWRYEKLNGYGAPGYLDTNLYVFPESNLIIICMQSKPLNPQISYESEALRLFAQMAQK